MVAEGIETEDQGDLLLEIGCKLGQGYLFSAAVTRESATELLLKHAQPIEADQPLLTYGLPMRSLSGRVRPEAVDLAGKGRRAAS